MPTVPDIGSMGSAGEYDQALEGSRPSATQVLLAAGTMHNQGRLVTGDSHIGYGGASPRFSSRMPVRSPKGSGRVKSRATGGSVEEGEPYLVGEHGPEIMVPQQGGKIVPAEKTKLAAEYQNRGNPFEQMGRVRGEVSGGGVSKGFKELEEVRQKTEQEQIKKSIPPVKSFREDLKFRTEGMSRQEILDSEVLWAKARDLAKGTNTSFTQRYKELANGLLRNKGNPVTDDEMIKVMENLLKYGIK